MRAIFRRPLDGHRVRRQGRRRRLSASRTENDGGVELPKLSHQRGSRSVPPMERGVTAENRDSETHPEETTGDGTSGQLPRVTEGDVSRARRASG